jgi:hypothetical protein
MHFYGEPQFVDPFGNEYHVRSNLMERFSASPPASYFYQLLMITSNLDRTAARKLEIQNGQESTCSEIYPETDFVLPVTFSALFLTFTTLWIRNACRRRHPHS